MMTNDEDEALVARYRAGDEEARNALIEARMGLIKHIARQHQGRGLPLDDLVQEGAVGLMVAIERFTIPGPFVAFAGQHIRGKILLALREKSHPVYFSRSILEDVPGVARAFSRLRDRLQREPDVDEVSQETGLPRSRVLDALYACGRPASLDATIPGTTQTLGDIVPAPAGSGEGTGRRDPWEMLTCLNDRDREIVRRRCCGMSWHELASDQGVSHNTVKSRYARAIEALRRLDWSDYL